MRKITQHILRATKFPANLTTSCNEKVIFGGFLFIPSRSEKGLLLLGDSDSSATSSSGLSVLTTDTEEPVMTKTTVAPDLNIFTLQMYT